MPRRTALSVQHSRQQADGLNRATVEWIADGPLTPLRPQYQPLVGVLRKVMARLANIGRFIEPITRMLLGESPAGGVSAAGAGVAAAAAGDRRSNERLGLLAPLIDTGRR